MTIMVLQPLLLAAVVVARSNRLHLIFMSVFFRIFPFLLLGCTGFKPKQVSRDTVVEKVNIQPAQALDIAEEHLKEHGTVVWRDSLKLRTHIVLKGKCYYVKRSDFPAKTIRWYLHNCIRINSKSGKTTYIE